ncbi:hypothetical protein DVH05_027161 [Phytophthora capsici]|nr:hypothetical protein DVH05_027161 [Phytophthora capsici]
MEEDRELLERARRLCLAARQLELPVLVPGFGRVHEGLEEKAIGDETALEEDKLPLIAIKHGTKSLKQDEDKAKLEQIEKKKHKKEMERVKQAQERARARVARTNQLEHEQTLREVEQQQADAVNAAEECAEKIRRAQESRRRANERVRVQRREKTPDTSLLSTAPGVNPNSTKLKFFHRKTTKRVSNRKANHSDNVDPADCSERNEDAGVNQKLLERRLRLETAARLKRMRQFAENQNRQEQEEFEQNLQKFKNKLKEMDRVARGLGKQPSIPHINDPPTFHEENTTFRQGIKTDTRCPGPIPEKLVLGPDSDEPNSPTRCTALIEVLSPRTADPNTRRSKSRSRLPVWKQPPVPLQPTYCYSYKAIIPSYSRTSVTASGYSTAPLFSGTRFRAQEISRQMK